MRLNLLGLVGILVLISVTGCSGLDPETLGDELREALLQIGLSEEGKTVDWNDYPKGWYLV